MTSHDEYVADQDIEQLKHLVKVTQARIEELTMGGWTWVWVVADFANQAWFADEAYPAALAYLQQLGRTHLESGNKHELSLERRQYRAFEAQALIAETAKTFG